MTQFWTAYWIIITFNLSPHFFILSYWENHFPTGMACFYFNSVFLPFDCILHFHSWNEIQISLCCIQLLLWLCLCFLFMFSVLWLCLCFLCVWMLLSSFLFTNIHLSFFYIPPIPNAIILSHTLSLFLSHPLSLSSSLSLILSLSHSLLSQSFEASYFACIEITDIA